MKCKIKPELLATVQSIELNYQLAQLNKISMQTAERWVRNNDKNLLIYPNLILILSEINKQPSHIKNKIELSIPDILIHLNY